MGVKTGYCFVEQSSIFHCIQQLTARKTFCSQCKCNRSSFQSGWNTILITCCRPHRRNYVNRAQVSTLPWKIKLILTVNSEESTNTTDADISADHSQMVILNLHNFTMETLKLHLKRYLLLSSFDAGQSPSTSCFIKCWINSLSDHWTKGKFKKTVEARMYSSTLVRSTKPCRPSAGGRPSATKGTSNINVHDFSLLAPNLIRDELLKVFSNSEGRATDIDPTRSDGESG